MSTRNRTEQVGPRERVVITGLGLYSPLGTSPEALLENLEAGHSGITVQRGHESSLPHRTVHAGGIAGHDPRDWFTPEEARTLERTAQFAVIAARQALAASGRTASAERTALVMGVSVGGLDRQLEHLNDPEQRESVEQAWRVLRSSQYAQTEAVASLLGVHGPLVTVSNACASSATAVGHACELLRQGKADVVIAGGAEAFSLLAYARFLSVGAMADGPCSPFSEGLGVTLGEGAGFVVLERLEEAVARGARLHGELLGFGATSDAHHLTAPHPTGEGLQRAMVLALADAGLDREEVGYINAHGTGTRDNDSAETLAIRGLYEGAPTVPPVSSSKSFLGHALGAAGILEFITSLVCRNQGLLPPTMNLTAPRPGCDLDYVPNQVRPANVSSFLSNSAALGGVNSVLVGGEVRPDRALPPRRQEDVVITGLGVISPVGCTLEEYAESLRQRRSGIVPVPQDGGRGTRWAAPVREFQPRRLLPTLETRRMDRLNQYATVAAGLALKDAGLHQGRLPGERIGVVVGLTRGPAEAQGRFYEELLAGGIEQASPKHFAGTVFSTIAGQVTQSLQLRGMSSTVVDGPTSGLHALVHAHELLRDSDTLDAVVVVAADALVDHVRRLYERCGLLADADAEALRPYDPRAGGLVLGEGAVALVLERSSSARARQVRVRACLQGSGQTADARGFQRLEPEGQQLERAMRLALAEAGVSAESLEVVYGHGRGVPVQDGREALAFQRLLGGRPVPVACVMGNTGVAEAACGLFSVAAAVLGLEQGEAWPVASTGSLPEALCFVRDEPVRGAFHHVLVAGGTDSGNNAAVLLTHPRALDRDGAAPTRTMEEVM